MLTWSLTETILFLNRRSISTIIYIVRLSRVLVAVHGFLMISQPGSIPK